MIGQLILGVVFVMITAALILLILEALNGALDSLSRPALCGILCTLTVIDGALAVYALRSLAQFLGYFPQ